MDLRQLRYFVAIVEAGSFSKAAQALRIAQPALSLHVRNMEADLGTDLLTRTPQGVVATAAGLTLLDNAREILARFEATRRLIRDQGDEIAGEVLIGLPGTIGQQLSVPLILKARTLYPKVRLRVTEAMSGFVLEWLRDGRVDLGLLYLPVAESGLQSEEMLREELCLFGPAGGIAGVPDPSTGETGGVPSRGAVCRLPLILPSAGHGLRALVEEQLAHEGGGLDTVLDVDSYAAIKELVGHGLAYSILPVTAVAEGVADGTFRTFRIGDPPLARSVHLVHPYDRPVGKATIAIADLCRRVLVDLVRSGRWHGELVATVAEQE